MDLRMKGSYTVQDYQQAQKLHSGYRTPVAFACFMLVAMSLVRFLSGNIEDLRDWGVMLAVTVIGVIVFTAFWRYSLNRNTKKTFLQQKELQIPFDVSIKEAEFTFDFGARGFATFPWAETFKWKANENVVLIYPSQRLFRMFPRRWFSSAADYAAFKELLAKEIGEAGRGRKN